MPWPDYCSKTTLAKRLDLAVGAIEQYVRRGLLPRPVRIGEAERWDWRVVDSMLQSRDSNAYPMQNTGSEDPYLMGARRAHETASSREDGPQQDRPPVSVSDAASRNGKSGTSDPAT